jgi:hypothetical protein
MTSLSIMKRMLYTQTNIHSYACIPVVSYCLSDIYNVLKAIKILTKNFLTEIYLSFYVSLLT